MTLDEEQTYISEFQAAILREFNRLQIRENLPWRQAPLDAGDVVWVDFDEIHPTENAQIKKLRPAIVFQNRRTSEYSKSILVIPISTSKKTQNDEFYPHITHKLTGTKVEGGLLVNALQTVDKSAIVEREAYGDLYDYQHTLYPKILRALQLSVTPV